MDRHAELIRLLQLQPHPEGGHYRRLHLAQASVLPTDGRGPRGGLSAIVFLLGRDEVSRWHRLASDEIWTWMEGAPLELHCFEAMTATAELHLLGAAGQGRCVQAVAAGWWQSARSQGEHTLVSCVVGPAFDFADFAFMQDHPQVLAALRANRPQWLQWV